MVKLMKAYQPDKVVLSIGDGANDVSMITEANVGVGLSGNEGSQAASSSDFAISEFQQLRNLLMVHGRENYRKNTYMIQYNFYKNMVYSVPMTAFGSISGYSGQTLYEIYLLQIFNVVFTMSPIIVYCLFDQQFEKAKLKYSPRLYVNGMKDHAITYMSISGWYGLAFFEGLTLWYFCQMLFGMDLTFYGQPLDLEE